MASSSDSSLGCKPTQISVENIHTLAIFWIASLHVVFPGMFYHQSEQVHCFLPLTVLATLTSKNHGTVWNRLHGGVVGTSLHCSNFQLHNHKTSEYVSTYNSQKMLLSLITFLHKVIVSTEGSDKWKKRGVSQFTVVLLQSMVLRMWDQKGSECLYLETQTFSFKVFITLTSDAKQLRNACIRHCAWKHQYVTCWQCMAQQSCLYICVTWWQRVK